MATGWKWPCHFWARAFPWLSKSLWFCFPLPQRTLRHHVETGGEPWDGWSDYMGQNAALNYTRPAEKARNKLCVLKDWDLRVLGDWNTTWPILTSTRDYVWWVVYKEGPPLNHICQNSHLCTVPWLWLWVGPVNSLLTSKMEWNWTWLPKSGLKKLHGFCLGFLGISFGTRQLAFKKSEYLRTPSCEKVLTRYVERLCEKREYCLTSPPITVGSAEAPAMEGKRPSWTIEPSPWLGKTPAAGTSLTATTWEAQMRTTQLGPISVQD